MGQNIVECVSNLSLDIVFADASLRIEQIEIFMPRKDDDFANTGNPFHKRMSDLRQNVGSNLNENELLSLLRTGGKNPYLSDLEGLAKRGLTDEEVDQRAFFDDKTPTYNFRYMLRLFHRELIRANRYRRPLSVCIIIVDALANVMKEYGQAAVDLCIMASAETLISCCRSDIDMVGRYADDRFMIMLPETPGTGAAVMSERIRKKMQSLEIMHQWYKIKLTASIGIAYFPGHGGGVEELIAQADLAAESVHEHRGNGIAYAPESSDLDMGSESWS
jgi:diguanylate cyclase (GGDEF)-like protein